MSINALKKAVVLAPEDAEARYRLAEAFFEAGKRQDAQKQLSKLFALDAKHPAGRKLEQQLSVAQAGAPKGWDEAAAFAEKRRFHDAVLFGQQAAALAPDDPYRWAQLADWCGRCGLFDRGLLHLGHALQLKGHHGAWEDMRDELLRAAGESDPVDLFTEAPLGKPRDALQHVLDGDVVAAKRSLATVSAAEKATALFHRLRGEIWQSEGELARAKTAFEAAAKLDPRGYHVGRLQPHLESKKPGRLGVLLWTEVGGGVTLMEAVAVMGAGTLRFTGNVGDSMRESCHVAYTALKEAGERYQLDGLLHAMELHINFDMPGKADGSSGGLALALAGYSALKKKPLLPHLATTGAIGLHGDVKRIDGVHEKAVAARLHGIRRVLHPKGNTPDVKALPALVTEKVEFIAVRTLDEALQHAFP